GGNGVYAYGATSTFPINTYRSQNYSVDVVFSPATAATLTSIAVTPANPTVTVGGTQQFTATGTYSDASMQDLTSQVTWASSNTAAATITAAGLATAVSQGAATISARLGEVVGSTTLTVLPPGGLAITTTALPVGFRSTPYTTTLAAGGGTPPYTWAVWSGTLPTGLTLAGSTGVISGTPTATGTSNFTVGVTAGAQTATRALSLTIAPNEIAAENALPGNPSSQWDITGAGDPSIQGFATDMSVNRGDTINFKVNTNSTNYRFDIYRIGYYGGLRGRPPPTRPPPPTPPPTHPARPPDPPTRPAHSGDSARSGSSTAPPPAPPAPHTAN